MTEPLNQRFESILDLFSSNIEHSINVQSKLIKKDWSVLNWVSSQQCLFYFQCRSKKKYCTHSFHNTGADILGFSGDGLYNNARSSVDWQIWAVIPQSWDILPIIRSSSSIFRSRQRWPQRKRWSQPREGGADLPSQRARRRPQRGRCVLVFSLGCEFSVLNFSCPIFILQFLFFQGWASIGRGW